MQQCSWELTCDFKLVEAKADEGLAGGTGGLGRGAADSQHHIAGQAAGPLHKPIGQAGQVEAAPPGALLEALGRAGQEGPHPQLEVVDHTQGAPCMQSQCVTLQDSACVG